MCTDYCLNQDSQLSSIICFNTREDYSRAGSSLSTWSSARLVVRSILDELRLRAYPVSSSLFNRIPRRFTKRRRVWQPTRLLKQKSMRRLLCRRTRYNLYHWCTWKPTCGTTHKARWHFADLCRRSFSRGCMVLSRDSLYTRQHWKRYRV